jgi:hypothetical protein
MEAYESTFKFTKMRVIYFPMLALIWGAYISNKGETTLIFTKYNVIFNVLDL